MGTSRQGFVLLVLAAGDGCARPPRLHNVSNSAFLVLVGLGGIDDLLHQSWDVCEPSFEASGNCGHKLVQRLVLSGKASLWLSSDDRSTAALALLASLARWTSICLK